MSDRVLYILTGPTAVGKTDLAIEWAKRYDAEILSCDSLLFYKGMDIGTAKPSKEEQMKVRHHGIDIVSVSESFNINDYIGLAQSVIKGIHERGKRVLITGGSGFYLKAFFEPVVDGLEVPESVDQEIALKYNNEGLEGIVKELMELNPDGVGDLDLRNPRRVHKALARCLASGKTVLELKIDFEAQDSPFGNYEKRVVLLKRDPESLKKRIALRVDQMLSMGLIDEVRKLLKEGIRKNPSAFGAIGYREVIHWLESGEGSLRGEIVKNTERLVAKQRKWFRYQLKADKEINLDEANEVKLEELFTL